MSYDVSKNKLIIMTNILNSASKIVFILMTLAVIILTVIGIVEAKDFIVLASMAFAFYFSNKPTDSNGTILK
jgi:hypothetical protein